jgi:hypothetical protein
MQFLGQNSFIAFLLYLNNGPLDFTTQGISDGHHVAGLSQIPNLLHLSYAKVRISSWALSFQLVILQFVPTPQSEVKGAGVVLSV